MIDAWLHRFRTVRISVFGAAALAVSGAIVTAQDMVNIAIPPSVSFQVNDVASSSSGTPNPATITFSGANLAAGNALRVSVQSDAASFTPPSGAGIPASRLTWTTSGSSGGTGFHGTLSSSSYGIVFQGNGVSTSGQVGLAWTLLAPGAGIRAGTHQLTIRWRIESITP